MRQTLRLDLPTAPLSASYDWREDPRAWLPAPSDLARACRELAQRPADLGLQAFLDAQLGAPSLDALVTPLSARASLLGMARGCTFAHHELRVRLPMPEGLAPELAVWDEGTVPVWRDGVLEEPKYFSFFQDAPVPVFNPNHRRQWRPHELLHAAQGFYWSPQMHRFGFALGARLNEILPVVHWYALDQAFRPACPAHLASVKGPPRQTCPKCEAAARPYWGHDPAWLDAAQAQAQGCFERGWEHLAQEWAAMLHELDTGERAEVLRVGLDSSSDAVGYLRAHWPRVTAWSFGAWVELFLQDGDEVHSTLENAFARASEVARALSSGQAALDEADFARAQLRRGLQDLGYRALLLLEDAPEGSRAYRALMPAVERMADAVRAARDPLSEPAPLAQQARQAVEEVAKLLKLHARQWPDGLASSWGAVGWPSERAVALGLPALPAASLAQWVEGLRSAAPMSCEALGEPLEAQAQGFAAWDDAQRGLGRLAERWASHAQTLDADAPWTKLAAFEAWIGAEPRRDEDADAFGVLPEDLEQLAQAPGTLRPHATLRRMDLSHELATAALEEVAPDYAGALAAIRVEGEPRVLPLTEAQGQTLDLAASGQARADWVPRADPDALWLLLEQRFLVWMPR
jgi:hypothetical protein